MMDLINFLTTTTTTPADQLCNKVGVASLTTIVGYVVLGIKVIAPIILIIVGMIDMTKAIAGKDEDTIKKAQKALGKKAIAAVVVFLIATMVGLLMSVVNFGIPKNCSKCINNPFQAGCTVSSDI